MFDQKLSTEYLVSNYTSGRDSNRGGCAHSCRFEYTLEGKESSGNKKELKSLGIGCNVNCYFISEDVRKNWHNNRPGLDTSKSKYS